MNTKRIIQGDIIEMQPITKTYEQDILWGEDYLGKTKISKTQEIPIVTKKKVIFVKYMNDNYVEITKLKSFKDIIKIYYEILFCKNNNKYLIRCDDFLYNKPYIDDTSIEKPNIKLKKYESLKSIKKKVLTKNQNI